MAEDKKRFDDVSSLTQLGKSGTEYKFDEPTWEMLETFPNRFPNRDYVVVYRTDEFTSLCPRTNQPDFGVITIEYIPRDKCIETKSLKLYLFAYRNYGIFMESIVNKILDDCVKAADPKWMRVIGNFKARGGITIDVVAEHGIPPMPGMPLGVASAEQIEGGKTN